MEPLKLFKAFCRRCQEALAAIERHRIITAANPICQDKRWYDQWLRERLHHRNLLWKRRKTLRKYLLNPHPPLPRLISRRSWRHRHCVPFCSWPGRRRSERWRHEHGQFDNYRNCCECVRPYISPWLLLRRKNNSKSLKLDSCGRWRRSVCK